MKARSAEPTSLVFGLARVLAFLGACAWGESAAAEAVVNVVKVAPTAPANAMGTFELHTGLRIEQVAAEPLVASPVAAAFDENGRLYVAEMLDYPESQNGSIGRVRLLVDTDGDGIFDRSSIFADRLPYPSALACANGGVFVGSTPDVLFLKDNDGDLRADERRVIFTGFGNPSRFIPARVFNGFSYGLDNRFYGVTSNNGGKVSRADGKGGEALELRGKDFSFDSRTLDLRPESGSAQYGITFDDFGRRFVCSNSNHVIMVMYEYRYGARNPFYNLPRPLLDIPVDGPAARVFRISPEESWRVLRTQWRVSGKARGPTEGGQTSGFFTAASGVTVYRGDALPTEFYGNIFVGELANNLVHRKLLRPDGVAFAASRAEEEKATEFLRSRDSWFRPVNFLNGPDGALYILDMYRELIEEPPSIPTDIVRHYATGEGSDRGRIYRVVAAGFRQPAPPKLGTATAAELVEQLASPNGWRRDTAARLLHERQDRNAAAPLAKLAASAKDPVATVRALYALDSIGGLAPAHLLTPLASAFPEVREHAIRLAEPFLGADGDRRISAGDRAALRQKVLQLAGDPADRVRYQLAFTLGNLPVGSDATDALLRLAEHDVADSWISAAVLSSLNDNVGEFFARFTASDALVRTPEGRAFVASMLSLMGARGKTDEMTPAVRFLASVPDDKLRLSLVSEFQAGLSRSRVPLRQADPEGLLTATVQAAAGIAADSSLSVARRISAIQLLAGQPAAASDDMLLKLLSPSEPQKVQMEAMAALGVRSGNPAKEVVARWRGFTPNVRQEAIKLLAARPERASVMLAALRDQQLAPTDLSAGEIQVLTSHPDEQVRREAAAIFAGASGNRAKVIAEFRDALALAPNRAAGKTVFANVCAPCHRLDGMGSELGPNLLGVKGHGKESILIDILDPNRKLDPAYAFYQIELTGGQSLLGAIADETPTSLTVKQAFGSQTVLPRKSILKMQSLGQSMMPEGLEHAIGSKQAMADLLEYLVQVE